MLYDFDIGISPLTHKCAFVTAVIINGFGKIIHFYDDRMEIPGCFNDFESCCRL